MSFLQKIGLAPSDDDKKLKSLVESSYKSVRVIGRGTIKIDPAEIRSSSEFKSAREKAKRIVSGQ